MCLIRNFRCSSENIRYAMGSKGGLSHIQTTTRCNGRVDELLPKLAKVNNFKIPRCILLPATERIEIHGFSDASERAYAAVVYIKCFNESGQSQTRLLCSKSRVAPLKTLTIPRLELSAALLLSRLVKRVVPILQLSIHKIWMWTDSTIALAWIKTEPHKLKTFVSNRVAEIQALSKDYHWKHVSSKNNPDDLISRGCNVDELLKNEMWFSGPDLQTDEYEDNQLFPDPSYRDELKCAVTLSMTEFINNIKAKESCNKEKYLTADEVKRSTEFLAKIAQLSEFKAEIDALKKGKGVSKTQQRNKWQFEKNNVAVGCLVLLKENDLPPCKWTMARILEVIYGTDGKSTQILTKQVACQDSFVQKLHFGEIVESATGPPNFEKSPIWRFFTSCVFGVAARRFGDFNLNQFSEKKLGGISGRYNNSTQKAKTAAKLSYRRVPSQKK
ncbi:DUF1758 domain-containing protein [Trichonephila clavipes]|nr:DUF1758 domain-containing protein [Trichonephila clavipes]